ncbi:MAG: aldo/keto reductase [Bacteroidaceae bacterium]|nr:aldo/keto reductase [Bacteroidaceae bacterium]
MDAAIAKSGVKREDIFLVTKVWISNAGEEQAAKSIDESLRKLQNIDIFDFSLSDEDMTQIAKMNQHDAGTRDFGDPQFVKYLIETYG